MKFFRVNKAFTLIELILVIILISSTYFLVFSGSSFTIKPEKTKITLIDLKDFLLKNFKFERELSFVCIEDKFTCYVKIDSNILKSFKVENFFNTKPDVYEYNQNELRIDFDDIRIDDISNNVIFELKIDNDYKSNEFILDTLEDKVYIFNSLFKKAKLFASMSEVVDDFNKKQLEVRDAF